MKNILVRIFYRPQIVAKLLRNDKVKVTFTNATKHETMLILYTLVRQAAKALGMQERELMNKIIDLDKTMVKTAKQKERQGRYNR